MTAKKVLIEPPKKAPAKKRAPKPKPTKEELKKLMQDGIVELEAILKDLTEEYTRIKPMNLKRTSELIEETLRNLKEDSDEMAEQIKELDQEVVEPK